MSDTVNPSTPVIPEPTPAPSPTPAPKPTSDSDLPEWARKQISDANQEAANYRVQLKTAKDLLATAQEQVSSLSTEKTQVASSLSSVQTDFEKLVTAVQTLVPDKNLFVFAKTLQGNTPEELAAHASELQQMLGASSSAAVDRSQGQGAPAQSTDPGTQFASFLQSQLSR